MSTMPRGEPGTSLGRYHLADPLGGGPTGEVFRAKVYGVAGFERQFAVKKFHPALVQDTAAAEMIAAAARAYGTIEHPRVARMHEYGVAGGTTFVAVELVNGVDMSRLVAHTFGAGEPINPGAVLSLIAQVARAVAYAHDKGVLHLGLCPTNVLASADGDVKVCDFGFLRARLRSRPADDPTLLPRLPYLAPEQLDGAEPTRATDVFALAALATELLTGERAFPGKVAAEIVARIKNGPPADPPLPPLICDVLRRALAVSPTARYRDAGGFADALDAAVRKAPLPGGRADIAGAVKRALAKAAEQAEKNMSGAMTFPLPAPPGAAAATPRPPTPPPEVEVHEESIDTMDITVPRLKAAPSDRPLFEIHTPPPPGPAGEEILELVPEEIVPVMVVARPAMPPPIPLAKLPPPIPAPEPTHDEPEISIIPDEPPRRRGSRAWLFVLMGVCVAGGVAFVVYDQVFNKPGATPTKVAKGQEKPAPAPAPASSAAPAVMEESSAPAPAVAVESSKPAPPVAVESSAPAPAPVAKPASSAEPPPSPVASVASSAPPVVAAVSSAPKAPPPPPPPPPAPAAPDGKLTVASDPAGATVYLDGASKGKTPLELPGTADKHKLAVVLPGYKLYKADINGGAHIDAKLEGVERFKGPAGIKVRCNPKTRVYITIDGHDTGLLCPTERINVELGEHTVDLYDLTTDATSTQKVDVKETHNSFKITLGD